MSPKKKTMIFLTSQAVTLFGSTLVQSVFVLLSLFGACSLLVHKEKRIV